MKLQIEHESLLILFLNLQSEENQNCESSIFLENVMDAELRLFSAFQFHENHKRHNFSKFLANMLIEIELII